MRALALVLALAACRGGGDGEERKEPPGPQPTPAPAAAKLAPIDYAPEGSPFVIATLDPAAKPDAIAKLASGALDDLARRPHDEITRFALAVVRDLRLADGAARFAIYEVGGVPALRAQVVDERAGEGVLERAAAGLASADRAIHRGQNAWWVTDLETSLVGTVHGGHLLLAVGSRAQVTAAWDALLAAPASNAAARVRDAAARHELAPQLVVDASAQTVLEWLLAGDPASWWHPAPMPAECRPILDELAVNAPRAVAGLAAAPAPGEGRAHVTIELGADARQRLEGQRGAPPLWDSSPDRVLFAGHLGLRGGAARVLAADLRDAINGAVAACGSNERARRLGELFGHAAEQMWAREIRSASLIVVAARDAFLEAYGGVAADDLAPVIDRLKRDAPAFRAPPADGVTRTALAANEIPGLRAELLAARQRDPKLGDVLLVLTKNEAQKRVGSAPSSEPAPLAFVHHDPDDAPPRRYVLDVDDRGLTLTVTVGPDV